ncbi:MAG: sulfate/molybdate ABC transporter ATP-binding protein [Lentisphaeria bacterium]
MSIETKNIYKTFGNLPILKNINLQIKTGELTALLGPSGSGKTTLLRIIAGLEYCDQNLNGDVILDGKSVLNHAINNRQIGFVFQHYALFRHMTIFENIAFGLRVKPKKERPSEEQIRAKVTELLDLIQLKNIANRFPSQISGGQRQRVALARALAVEPKVLLLDEPFGALDAKVRADLRRWLRELHDTLHITSLFVTHDQEEAMEVADNIIIMNQGQIEQVGSPNDVFHQPASEFVMRFLGEVNIFQGRVESSTANFNPDISSNNNFDNASLLVRPHELTISRHKDSTKQQLPGTIYRIVAVGSLVKIEVIDSYKRLLQVHLSHEQFSRNHVKTGDKIFLEIANSKIYVNTDAWHGDYVI